MVQESCKIMKGYRYRFRSISKNVGLLISVYKVKKRKNLV